MDNEKVGKYIVLKRKRLFMTQQDLAEKLGVTNKAVSKWERGEGYPEITLLPKLSEVLGITVDELLLGEDKDEVCINSSINSDKYIKMKSMLLKSFFIAICLLLIEVFVWIEFFRWNIIGQTVVLTTIILCIVNILIIVNNKEKNSIKFKSDNIMKKRLILLMWLWSFILVLGVGILSPDKLINRFVSENKNLILLIFAVGVPAIGTIMNLKRKRI